MKKKLSKWNKYNIKSLKVPKGKQGSEYYQALLGEYGTKEANKRYQEFVYQRTHGQKTPINY